MGRMRRRDPVERESRGSRDLYDVVTWERRSALDSLAVAVYRLLLASARAFVVLLALSFLLAQFVLGGMGVIVDPLVGTLVLLSVMPALALAAYIWHADITTEEPLSLLVATFLLAILFATFAGVLNSLFAPVFMSIPIIGLPLFFFLVVGPVEETVKLLAIRLYAYRDERFDAVIDGTVYGAVAGLGFATIENALYIARGAEPGLGGVELLGAAGGIAVFRALVGPGHVIFSAIAGYYLGMAKFNPENGGPIVVKGLIIVAAFHALYNTLAGVVPSLLAASATWITPPVAVIVYIVLYDSLVAYFLYRKIAAYRRAYRDAGISKPDGTEHEPEVAEFDP